MPIGALGTLPMHAQTFTELPSALESVELVNHVRADFDNDGDLDVIISGYGDSFTGAELDLN